MNRRNMPLYSFHSFDKYTGTYYLKCACGTISPLRPEDMTTRNLLFKCRNCFLNYSVSISCDSYYSTLLLDMDMGIAHYYLKQYDEAIAYLSVNIYSKRLFKRTGGT